MSSTEAQAGRQQQPPKKLPSERYLDNTKLLGLIQHSAVTGKKLELPALALKKLQQFSEYYFDEAKGETAEKIERVRDTHWTHKATQISAKIKTDVLSAFVEKNHLKAEVAFELADAYFLKNGGKLNYLTRLEEMIDEELKKNRVRTPYGQPSDRKKKFEDEYKAESKLIASEMRQFYLHERKKLLSCLERTMKDEVVGSQVHNFFSTKLIQSFRTQVFAQLKRNLTWDKEFRDPEPAGLQMHLQWEQVKLLTLLFYSYRLFPVQDPKEHELFTVYLENCGSETSKDPFEIRSIDEEYIQNKSLIKDLNVLTGLAISMRCKKGNNFDKIKEMVFDSHLNAKNAPIKLRYMHFLLTENVHISQQKMSDFTAQALSTDPIQSVTSLLNSEVFRADSMRDYQDHFALQLKEWMQQMFDWFRSQDSERYTKEGQELSSRLLSHPVIVKEILADLKADRGNVSLSNVKGLQIFSDVLRDPFCDSASQQTFFQLLESLCGAKRSGGAEIVYDILVKESVKSHTMRGSVNMMQQVLSHIVEGNEKMKQNKFENVEDFNPFSSALILISKMIKQHKYVDLCKRTDQLNQYRNLLEFLVDSLLNLIERMHFSHSKRAISNLLGAIITVYDRFPEERSKIIEMLKKQRVGTIQDFYPIVYLFKNKVMQDEHKLKDFQVTAKFLQLICKMLKQQNPMANLPCNQVQENIKDSFLMKSLHEVYKPLMHHYFQFKFEDANAIGKLTASLLKLTRTLLSKFQDVPTAQKAPLNEPYDHYDAFLDQITQVLNDVRIQKISLNALSLVECQNAHNRAGLSYLENKFVHEAKKSGRIHDRKKQMVQLISMVTESLETLILLLQLSSVAGTQTDKLSKRASYIRKLTSVTQLEQQVLDPSRSEHMPVESYTSAYLSMSLFSQIAFYATLGAESGLRDVSRIKIGALRFLTNCCLIWSAHGSVCTLSDLVGDGLTPVQRFLGKMKEELLASLKNQDLETKQQQTLLTSLDFFCVTAHSQPRFTEMCFKGWEKELCSAVVSMLEKGIHSQNQLQTELKIQLRFKLIIFFSLLAQHNLCFSLLEHNNHSVIKSLYDNVVRQDWFQSILREHHELKGQVLRLEDHTDNKEDNLQQNIALEMKVTTQCRAKVALSYFIQLAAAQYGCGNQQSDKLGEIVIDLFQTFTVDNGPQSKWFASLAQTVERANNYLKSEEKIDEELQRQVIETSHQPFENNDRRVYIKSLSEEKLWQAVKSKPDFWLMLTANLPNTRHFQAYLRGEVFGNLGSEFFISVSQELHYAQTNDISKFSSPVYAEQYRLIFKEMNLALSCLHTDIILQQSKRNFMANIGQAALASFRLMDSDLKHTDVGEGRIRFSFLPLVVKTKSLMPPYVFPKVLNPLSKDLLLKLIKIAKTLFTQTIPQHDSFDSENESMTIPSFYKQKVLDVGLDYFQLVLGAINSQVCGLVEGVPPQMKIELQEFTLDGVIPALAQLANEGELSNLTQIMLQCLQIFMAVDKEPRDQFSEEAQHKKLALPVNQILACVVNGMRKGSCLAGSLQIIQLLIDAGNDERPFLSPQTLDQFMKKQDSMALRVMIGRLADQGHEILSVLTSYASSERGAMHLHELNILRDLNEHQCMKTRDPVYKSEKVQVRNPAHILWCQMLVLTRTLNQTLIDEREYFRDGTGFLKALRSRLNEALLAAQDNPNIALLEEIELLTGCVQQICQSSFLFNAEEDQREQVDTVKQEVFILLVAACDLLSNEKTTKSLQPHSNIEQHLSTVGQTETHLDRSSNHCRVNAFSLKAEISLAKIHFNVVFAFHGFLLSTRKGLRNTHVFDSFWKAQCQMRKALSKLDQTEEKLLPYLATIFANDENIKKEYAGNLNLIILDPLQEGMFDKECKQALSSLLSSAIVAGQQVACLLVEHEYLQQAEQPYYFGGGQRIGAIFEESAKKVEQSLQEMKSNKNFENDKQFLDQLHQFIGDIKKTV